MTAPIVFGAPYSVYVRIVRLTLAEKGVSFRLDPVDVFTEGGPGKDYLKRHPFGKIPAFEHDGLTIFETGAITRYIDEAFAGPRLQPETPTLRAKMNQAIGLLDAYAYRAMVWDVYVERIERPADGRTSDEARISAALPVAKTCLTVLEQLSPGSQWLAADTLSLTDIHAAPMFAYFVQAPEGMEMLSRYTRLSNWWAEISRRPSFIATLD